MRLQRSKARNHLPPAYPSVPSNLAPAGPAQTPESIAEELIAARAYEIWERRGRPHGEHERNWFAAREELEQERLGWAALRAHDVTLRP